jgi:hypothetical protein
MGEMRNESEGLVGKPDGRDHLEDTDIDERIMLNLYFKEIRELD